jgi:hypothetical protein
MLCLFPAFGFYYGMTTDNKASVWCYYTSLTSLIAIALHYLHKFKVYNILQ